MPSPIRPLDLKSRLSADPLRVYLLDVRQPQEHEFAAIPGDQLIPLDELPRRAQEIDLAPGQTYTVDTGHMVAWTDGVQYAVRKVGGWKSTLFSGEGLVCDLTGPGRIYLQTRSQDAFLSWLIPQLPTPSST